MLREVSRPGRHTFAESSTLLEALSFVGGLTKERGNRVVVMRRSTPGAAGAVQAVVVDTTNSSPPRG